MNNFLTGALAALLLSFGSVTSTSPAEEPIAAPATKPLANDGYYIEQTTQNMDAFYVRIVKYKTYDELGKAWKANGGSEPKPGRRTVAFARWSNDGKSCVIHMIDPLIEYRPQFIGHEFVHCMHGSFHPTQG